jgi:hypothetical protein
VPCVRALIKGGAPSSSIQTSGALSAWATDVVRKLG